MKKDDLESYPLKSVMEWLSNALAEHFYVSVETISPDTALDELGADSLDIVDIALTIEGEYDIEISDDDELKRVRTVGELVHQIQKRCA